VVRVSVLGLGPVGLVTALCFAKRGYSVVGVDVDKCRVDLIRAGKLPFIEPSLDRYLKDAVERGTFEATSDMSINKSADVSIITVGTPSAEDGSIDLSHVKSASIAIGQSLRDKTEDQLVLVKSTVIPGTTRNLVKPLLEEYSGKKLGNGFKLCSNPEFLREGKAIYDSEFPDRIVIGGEREEDLRALEELYKEFYREKTPPIVKTSYENAELIKYANNSFLAMKISYINMIANLCQQVQGADVVDVAKGIGLDKRIGSLFLNAGLGWGGSCFPKDLKAFSAYAKMIRTESSLLDDTKTINDHQPSKAAELAESLLTDLKGKRIALLGLAFKADTDDMRQAVSIPLVKTLLSRGAEVIAYDPAAITNAKPLLDSGVKFASTAIDCITGADCCILVTEWEEFKKIKPETFREKMRYPAIVDGRRIFDPSEFKQANVRFSAIGLNNRD